VRVVMVSKALAVGAYQRKLEEIARLPGVELTAIVPSEWRDRRGYVRLERAHVSGYELIAAPLAFNGQYHFHFYPTLGRLLKRLHPDILHMDEEPYNLATWHALRLGQAVGARGIFFTWQNLNRRYPWPFRAFEVANYRRAAYAIAGNRAAVDVLRAKGFRGPSAVIPQFGVDPEIYRPKTIDDGRQTTTDRPPSSVVRRPSSFVIGYAGALIPEKGVDLLLRACAGLPDLGWRLAIVGNGPARALLDALTDALAIRDRVDFLGQRASTQMPEVYPTFDVLVLPSISRPNWKEQFGRVLIEAMACGVPVIGSDSGEIPNVIGDAGLIFPEGDVAALRDSIGCLLADSGRRARHAQAGRQRVLAEFTQAQIASATYRVYGEILSQQETA
jgi:glycosyltransferase involved in cell wall biosynthesis